MTSLIQPNKTTLKATPRQKSGGIVDMNFMLQYILL